MFYAVQKSPSPRQVVKYIIKVDWGRKCEGHVIFFNLIAYFISFSSVASNLSGLYRSSSVHWQQVSMNQYVSRSKPVTCPSQIKPQLS